jgi:hypothetical protein
VRTFDRRAEAFTIMLIGEIANGGDSSSEGCVRSPLEIVCWDIVAHATQMCVNVNSARQDQSIRGINFAFRPRNRSTDLYDSSSVDSEISAYSPVRTDERSVADG